VKLASLLYHDVVPGDDPDASGFRGAGAAVYKLTEARFRAHLEAIASATGTPPVRIADAGATPQDRLPWLLTFDDGGASAALAIADALAQRDWCGHFFVTTARIGTPGFVDEAAIRALVGAGHVVGSHSASHPARMSGLGPAALLDEWKRSADRLSDILGQPIRTASVPGGFYTSLVAGAAAAAGIRVLFNSEPVLRSVSVGECLVLGRLSLRRDDPPRRAAAFATGRAGPRIAQWLGWNARKAMKRSLGPAYERAREGLLQHRSVDP
jgi:peptidoglycan/xylan/chitin deacetylase (PgdA/CDA1 family)